MLLVLGGSLVSMQSRQVRILTRGCFKSRLSPPGGDLIILGLIGRQLVSRVVVEGSEAGAGAAPQVLSP